MMLILLLVLVLGMFVALAWYLLGSASKRQKAAVNNQEQILDDTFNGAEDVTVTVNMATLPYATYVTGGKARGYRLVHQAENKYGPHTLIFEKVNANV